MITATYDTNVLVSSIIGERGPLSFLIGFLIHRKVRLITSQPLLDELTRTLTKQYFTTRLPLQERNDFIALVRRHAKIVSITSPIPKIATHWEDDLVLATAESGKADYIVTGDYALLNLKKFKNIAIISPRAFVEILQNQ